MAVLKHSFQDLSINVRIIKSMKKIVKLLWKLCRILWNFESIWKLNSFKFCNIFRFRNKINVSWKRNDKILCKTSICNWILFYEFIFTYFYLISHFVKSTGVSKKYQVANEWLQSDEYWIFFRFFKAIAMCMKVIMFKIIILYVFISP